MILSAKQKKAWHPVYQIPVLNLPNSDFRDATSFQNNMVVV